MGKVFKTCSCCHKEWLSQNDFLSDSQIKLVGYKADLKKLDYSMFFFNHMAEDCYSTITLEALSFMNLYTGKKYRGRRTGESDCPGYCLDINQLSRCDAVCECAYNREICHLITTWEKNT